MREIQLSSLNQTQKLRLQRALEQLESLSSNTNSNASVIVADTIPVNYEDGVLKGHGTSELDGEVVATLYGVVERVNKNRVAPKRWRLEINFSQDAVLMLSSMNLLDGIQRRRTAVDELNKRSIFEEGDVVCAEIRGFQHDGSLQLQARSQKYGTVCDISLYDCHGLLITSEVKQHFHHLEQYGIDLILGCYGFIWVEVKDTMVEDQVNISDELEDTKFSRNSLSLEEQEQEQEQAYTPFKTYAGLQMLSESYQS